MIASLLWFGMFASWFFYNGTMLRFFLEFEDDENDLLSPELWLGLAFCSALSLAAACFGPVAWNTPLGYGMLGLAAFWTVLAYLDVFRHAKFAVAGILITGIFCAVQSFRPITWFDTAFYHQMVIRWMHDYGIVPGLAHMGENLGFISGWYALQAWIGWKSGLTVLNGLVFAICVYELAILFLFRAYRNSQNRFVILGLSILVVFGLWSRMTNSTSVDFPIMAILIFVVHYAINKKPVETFALTVAALSLKLSALGIIPVALTSFSPLRVTKKRAIKLGLFTLVLMAPLGFATAKATGWVFYPAKLISVKTDYAFTSEQMNYVHDHILTGTGQKSLAMSPKTKIFLLAGLVLGFGAPFLNLKYRRNGILCCLQLGLIFVLITNPDWRYVATYLIPLYAFLLAYYLPKEIEAWKWCGVAAAMFFLAWPFYKSPMEKQIQSLAPKQNLLLELPEQIDYQVKNGLVEPLKLYPVGERDGFKFYRSEAAECVWAQELTSGEWFDPENIRLRSPSDLSQGFKLNNKEKNK